MDKKNRPRSVFLHGLKIYQENREILLRSRKRFYFLHGKVKVKIIFSCKNLCGHRLCLPSTLID